MTRPVTIPVVAGAPGEGGDCSGAESFALMVLGDSMLPEFAQGEIVVIEPGGHAADGAYVLAQVRDDWTLRQLVRGERGWQLRALNAAYATVDIPDLSVVRGVVIQKARPGRRRATKRYID